MVSLCGSSVGDFEVSLCDVEATTPDVADGDNSNMGSSEGVIGGYVRVRTEPAKEGSIVSRFFSKQRSMRVAGWLDEFASATRPRKHAS